MPARQISESVCKSKSLAQLSLAAELFFVKLWTKVDPYGRIEADPELLAPEVFPRRIRGLAGTSGEFVAAEDVKRWLDELGATDHVRFYLASGGKLFLEIRPETWKREQRQYPDAKAKWPKPAPGLWRAKTPVAQSVNSPFPEAPGSSGESPEVPGEPVDSGKFPEVPGTSGSRARPLRSPTPTPVPNGTTPPYPPADAGGNPESAEKSPKTPRAPRTVVNGVRLTQAQARGLVGKHWDETPAVPVDPANAPEWVRRCEKAAAEGTPLADEAIAALMDWRLGLPTREPTRIFPEQEPAPPDGASAEPAL